MLPNAAPFCQAGPRPPYYSCPNHCKERSATERRSRSLGKYTLCGPASGSPWARAALCWPRPTTYTRSGTGGRWRCWGEKVAGGATCQRPRPRRGRGRPRHSCALHPRLCASMGPTQRNTGGMRAAQICSQPPSDDSVLWVREYPVVNPATSLRKSAHVLVIRLVHWHPLQQVCQVRGIRFGHSVQN